ncbi:hypothetical protein Dimus_013639, partial [Dionaea muscipula]
NVLPRFGKSDVASFSNLTYMAYVVKKKKINFQRLIIRDIAHIINTPRHELPFADLRLLMFKKDEKQPVETDFFNESILNKYGLKRKHGVWWLGTGETRRRDEVVDETKEDSATKEGTDNREESTPTGTKGESSYSEDTYFDVVDDVSNNVEIDLDDVDGDRNTQQGHDYQLIHLQAQLHQALQDNARLQELLKQHQQYPPPRTTS